MIKKERIWLAGVVAVLMTAILLAGFVGRINYETKSRYGFVSANLTNLSSHGLNNEETLRQFFNAGSKVVTVDPWTVKGMRDSGKLELITYSSLFINEDPLSQEIRTLLGDYPMQNQSLVAVVPNPEYGQFMKAELSYRYTDYASYLLADGQTHIFAFQNLTEENDLIVGYDYADLALVGRMGMKAAVTYPSYTFESSSYPQYFKQFINSNNVSFLILRDNPYDNQKPLSEELKMVMRSLDFTLVLWENENQIGNEKPFLRDELYQLKKQNAIRGFNMDKVLSYDKSGYRYRYYQWFNSLIERNTTFLNANILANADKDLATNLSLTTQAISDLTTSVKGYQFVEQRGEIPYTYPLNTMAMAGGVLALSLLYLYFLFIWKKLPKYFTEIYFGLILVTVILAYVFYQYLAAIFALAVMVFACCLITAVMFYLDCRTNGKKKLFSILGAVGGILLCAIIGISSLLGGIDFYTSTWFFHGVKISLLLPVLVAAVNAYFIYHSNTISLKELPKAFGDWIKKINRWILIPAGVVVLLAVAYYLIRSGKSSLILPVEDNFRKWLTDVLYIRPRFKEFLLGYPMFSLFVYFAFCDVKKEWKIIAGICATVLFTSILNTFCHTFTAVSVSLLRVVNGLLCGVIVSAILIGMILLVKYLIKRKQNPKEMPQESKQKEAKKASSSPKEEKKKEVQTNDQAKKPTNQKSQPSKQPKKKSKKKA